MAWLIKDMHEEFKAWGRPGGSSNAIIMKSDGEPALGLGLHHFGVEPPKDGGCLLLCGAGDAATTAIGGSRGQEERRSSLTTVHMFRDVCAFRVGVQGAGWVLVAAPPRPAADLSPLCTHSRQITCAG